METMEKRLAEIGLSWKNKQHTFNISKYEERMGKLRNKIITRDEFGRLTLIENWFRKTSWNDRVMFSEIMYALFKKEQPIKVKYSEIFYEKLGENDWSPNLSNRLKRSIELYFEYGIGMNHRLEVRKKSSTVKRKLKLHPQEFKKYDSLIDEKIKIQLIFEPEKARILMTDLILKELDSECDKINRSRVWKLLVEQLMLSFFEESQKQKENL